MIYDWYKIVNLDEFEDSGLVSQNVEVILDQVGLKTVTVMRGNAISLLYEGVFLSLNLGEKNPFEFDGHAIYLDANRDLWLGILNED